tara:strand:- start:91 stop:441 length:351 start_codon:yes stop_codon:yes gene_type:complete
LQLSIAFYDVKKKIILKYGSSKPCGSNGNKLSFHAEEEALKYCRRYCENKKYRIYIWRYSNDGCLKSAFCCKSCNDLLYKHNCTDKIFTFDSENNIISAITDNPEISLGYKIIREF